MQAEFKRVTTWLQANYPEGYADLNPPATSAELAELETVLGLPLPDPLRQLLSIHNGQKDEAGWLLAGQEFLSAERIASEWMIWQGLLDAGEFDGVNSEPDAGIKNTWWNAKWIPIGYNGCGDHICVDTDPAEGGTAGQVITMWHDGGERERLGASLTEWMDEYATGLENGVYIYSEEEEGIYHVDAF